MSYQKKKSREKILLIFFWNTKKHQKTLAWPRLHGEFVPQISLLIREKAYGKWIKINSIFLKRDPYIAMNALNEKLNLFWSLSHSLFRIKIFGTNFPRNLGSLSKKIGFLIFFSFFVQGHESKIWENDLVQTATLYVKIFFFLRNHYFQCFIKINISPIWRNYSKSFVFDYFP